MARVFNASPYLYCDTAPVSQIPLTIAAWVRRPSNPGADQTIVSIGDASNAAVGVMMSWRNVTGYKIGAGYRNSSANSYANSSLSTTSGTWYHAIAVYFSSVTTGIFVNGGNETYAGGAAITGLDMLGIGTHRYGTTADKLLNGDVAHVGVWSVALTQAERNRLYNNGIGADPRSVRPDALVAYWPLLNDDGDQDYWGNFHLTASGSPTYAQHPPVLMRSRPKYVILGSAAPSIATIDIAGTRQVGNTLTCNATSSPSGATFAYQWYMADDIAGTNQTAISGATAQTYELSYANIGAATKLYEGLDANGEAFIACGATPTKDAVEGDETVSSYVSITEAAVSAPAGSPFESAFIR